MSASAAPEDPSPLRRHRASIVLAVIYAVFFYWYTPFGGPLTEEEIEHYSEILLEVQAAQGEKGSADRWIEFMRSDTGDDFAMLNALDLRDEPLQVGDVAPGESSSDVMARYTSPFFSTALPNAAHPVLLGTAAARAVDVWGIKGADVWDQGGVVRYRSRRDVMRQIETIAGRARHAEGEGIHAYKIAALEKTIAYPMDPWFQLGDPRLVLGLIFLVLGLGLEVRKRPAA